MSLPDFDAVYRGDPVMPGADDVPWNLGEPQPAIARILREGDVGSPVLDAGCGVGVTARALARAGYEVVGVDASAAAVEQARRDVADEGLSVELAVADLTRLSGHDGRFATVIDSAVFHALDADRRPDYVRALAAACRPGAVLHVLVFDIEAELPDVPGSSVNGVTEAQLRDLVGAVWTVDVIEPATITARLPVDVAPDAGRDGEGRAVLSALRLRAHLG